MWHNDKEVNNPKELIILNMYTPNNKVSKYVKQKLIELYGEVSESKILVDNSWRLTLYSQMNKFNQQKIVKDMYFWPRWKSR